MTARHCPETPNDKDMAGRSHTASSVRRRWQGANGGSETMFSLIRALRLDLGARQVPDLALEAPAPRARGCHSSSRHSPSGPEPSCTAPACPGWAGATAQQTD